MEISEFDEFYKRLLQHALAAFLEVSPGLVQVEKIEEGSVKVTIALPPKLAEDLVRSYRERNSELASYLEPFPLCDIRPSVHPDLVTSLSMILGIPAEMIVKEVEGESQIGLELDALASQELRQRLETRLGIRIETQELRTLADAFKLSHLVEKVSQERAVAKEENLFVAMRARLRQGTLKELTSVENIEHGTKRDTT